MAAIIKLQDILSIVKTIDVMDAMEQAFVEYSKGNSVVPPDAELLYDKPKKYILEGLERIKEGLKERFDV